MNYPLFLSYQGATIGNGFVARINARAQMLASAERDGWWLFGVHPGGIAESGDTLDEAHARLGETLRLTLVDIASESNDYEDFKQQVESYFQEGDAETIGEWQAAVDVIRQVGDGSLGLPKIQAELGYMLEITNATDELRVDLNPAPFERVDRSTEGQSRAVNADLLQAA